MKEALETADALIGLCREQGFAQLLRHGMLFRAAAASWLDSPAKAISSLKDTLAARLSGGTRISQPFWTLLLVSACLRAGEVATGLTTMAEVFQHVARSGDRYNEAHSWLLHGQLLLAGGKGDELGAELSMQKALVIARKQSAKLPELAAATALAQLWQQQGKRGTALELLDPIYSWFTEGFDYPELRNARALLDQLSKS
jgi:predicted ATPase